MRRRNVSLVAFGMLCACKPDVADGTPECIEDMIGHYDGPCDSGARVDEYSFQGAEVYVFEPGTCGADLTSEVRDAKCEQLGFLGGISGNTEIAGDDFSNAVLLRTIWSE